MGGHGRAIMAMALCILVGACALPRGAPLEREVLARSDDALAGFAIYPVTRASLPILALWPDVGDPHLGWITTSPGSIQRVIAPNDTVDLVIYDTDENSLLLPPGQRQIALTGLRVSSGGSVFLPYIGPVGVAGTTPEGARERLQRAIEPIAPAAQVQLAFTEGRQNSVTLVGGAASPGIYPLPDRALTVTGLLALGGGVRGALVNPQIRLIRDGRAYGTSVERLYEEPRLDTLLRPGDQVIVEEDDRYFLSLGAAGDESLFRFPQARVTALEALALIGGLQDNRGNPEGVLVLRDYPRSALDAGMRGPREERVIFAIDLTSADGLFSAGQFLINSGDLVLVTESPVTTTETIVGIVGSLFGLTTRVTALGN
jgi:polysaccharide export outer membrane protein